jgi:hypothetical protein
MRKCELRRLLRFSPFGGGAHIVLEQSHGAREGRSDREQFDCATWLHKATEPPKEEFKREVEKHLTVQETEPWEIIYFKVYKSQLPVIEQALETAGLMLGNDESRGYCLEMICADFLAGASLECGEMKSPTAACPHESELATAHQAPDAKTNS